MKAAAENVVKWTLVLLILFILLFYFATSASWSPADTQIEKDFESYWKRISEMFNNATLLDKSIIHKSIGLNKTEVTIKYTWERKKNENGRDYEEHHDSEIKFIYKKQGSAWKLEKREDLKFF
jgi:hypothetical protein